MATTIVLSNGQLELLMTERGLWDGFVFDELKSWGDLPGIDTRMEKRPRQPGAFGPGSTDPDSLVVSIKGQYFAQTEAEAIYARESLTAMYNDGEPITMTVTDAVRTTSRDVYVAAIKFPQHRDRSHVVFTFDGEAADPKRYGTDVTVSTGLAVAGSGSRWTGGNTVAVTYALTENPAGSGLYQTGHLVESPAGSGLYVAALQPDQFNPGLYLTSGTYQDTTGVAPGFDWKAGGPGMTWGTRPIDGRLRTVNDGNTATVTTFTVQGGEMLDGFEIVNVNTGERLVYAGPVTAGTTVTLDAETRNAYINDSAPAGRYLVDPEWWEVPAYSARTVQFVARGPVTGAPTLVAVTASALY
jgi:hypothetical protein